MNEIRDLIVGIDFGKEYSQICYYDRKGDEARSLSMKAGGNQYEAPCILCWRPEQKDYCVGLEADYFVREKGGVMIDDVYGICEKSDSVLVEGQELAPWEILAQFLQGMLKFLGVAELVKNTKCVAVTLPGLTEIQVENFQKAFEIIGFPHEKYMLLDYGESFYYYVLSQKRETWNRSVGWYAFTPENVSFRKMTMNGATKPVTVKLEEAVETELPAEGQERDSEFGKFVQKTLGRDLFSSIQITGDGFSQDWAEQSVRLLCYQKRKVFYGNNLFAKGACAAGKEKTENKALKGYRFLSDSLVMADVGMEMRVMGSPTYYPLIEAGNNWYDSKASCEFILDDTEEFGFRNSAPAGTFKNFYERQRETAGCFHHAAGQIIPPRRRTPAPGKRPERNGNCSPTPPEQAVFRRSRPCCRHGRSPPPCTPAPAPCPRNGRWTAGSQVPAYEESVRKNPSPPGREFQAGYGAPAEL